MFGDHTDIELPAKDEFDAMDVTALEYEITPDENGAYVNLDGVRGTGYRDKLFKIFRIQDGVLTKPTRTPQKFIFSGHPGSGKTLELRRLHKELDDPNRYTAILIELDKDLEIVTFQAEDFFILLVTALAERMEPYNFDSKELDSIARDWLKDEEVRKELKEDYKIEFGADTEAGFSLLGLLKLKSKLKTLFSYDSITSRKIRQKVRANPIGLIRRFNLVLSEVRRFVGEGLGRDILFIMDGSEKILYNVYQKLFVKDAHLLRTLDVNAIFSIPIHAYFDIEGAPTSNFFNCETLPMIAVEKAVNKDKLAEIITKRVQVDLFFEDDVLDYCVVMSGGCPRQLLRIINGCLVAKGKERINLVLATKTCKELGQQMRELLRSEHLEVLRSGQFKTADPVVKEMLYQLVLLKYNGTRRINPLIDPSEFQQ